MELTDDQIRIRAWGEEWNQKARQPKQTAQDILEDILPNLNKKQEDFILMRENE